MKKNYLLFLFACSGIVLKSQNVGINSNGSTPNSSAILDLNTGNTYTSPNGKGLLMPNVSLTSTGDNVTVTSPATSLMVYNTATAGSGATAVSPGYYYWDGAKWVGFTGVNSKDWALLGNAGTTVGTNFLGTTDNTDLVFKVNSIKGGLIDIANSQTHFGYQAGLNNTAAGTWTSFFGTSAGQANTSGTGNSGFGYGALTNNTTGGYNTGIGFSALYNNTTGSNNSGVGIDALYYFGTTSFNTGMGTYALEGSSTVASNTGQANAALGFCAGSGYNGALGSGTNNNLPTTSGSYNTFLGFSTDLAAGTYSNTTTVGAFAQAGQSDALILGSISGTNGGSNNASIGVGTTTPGYYFHMTENVASHTMRVENSNSGAFTSIYGKNTAAANTAGANGVQGLTSSSTGMGVVGFNNYNVGAVGGTGIFGSGNNEGVAYLTQGSGGAFWGQYTGIWGYISNTNASGGAYTTGYCGVFGRVDPAHNTTSSASRYQFGTYGEKDQDFSGAYYYDYRSGGVLGVGYRVDNASIQSWGALGYKSSAGTDYGLYCGTGSSSTAAGGGGRAANNSSTPQDYLQGFGAGMSGDLMGSWSQGALMGSTSSGTLYAHYNLGNEYTSGHQADIVTLPDQSRVAAYSMTSGDLKVYGDGYISLSNGKAHVNFSKEFADLISPDSKPVITVTPNGNCNGVYITNVTSKGFDVIELNNGGSSIELSWIAIGRRVDAKQNQKLPEDLADSNFETNMRGVMFDEQNPNGSATPLWFDGKHLHFEQIPASLERSRTPLYPSAFTQSKKIEREMSDKLKK